MLTDVDVRRLEAAWAPARRTGVIGADDIRTIEAHAAGFLPAASALRARLQSLEEVSAIDVGTGAGIPGVMVAASLPRSRWRLVDADARRCRFASSAVSALSLTPRVEVVHGRVDELAWDDAWRGTADLVVARLFGAPTETLECAVPLLGPAGSLVMSTRAADRPWWSAAPLERVGAVVGDWWSTSAGSYVEVRPIADSSMPPRSRLPRRPAARRRAPLL